MNIPENKINLFDEIQSIDEGVEILDHSLEKFQESQNIIITPETEFWGHCSNLQVWVENDYDTKILHRTIAFPLLRKVSDIDDPKARSVLKDEIAKRVTSGHLNTILFLVEENYLRYLNSEDKEILFGNFNFKVFLNLTPERYIWILKKFVALRIN